MKQIIPILVVLMSGMAANFAHATSNREVLERHLKPVDFAKLSAHIYDYDDQNLPGDVTELAAETHLDVRYGYYRFSRDGIEKNILVVRGTVPSHVGSVIVDFGYYLTAPLNYVLMSRQTIRTLQGFENQYGQCSFATGHSLGGKILTYLYNNILSFSFNAFRNSNSHHVYDYRASHADIAWYSGSHTDYWVDASGHGIDEMVRGIDGMDWTDAILDRADELEATGRRQKTEEDFLEARDQAADLLPRAFRVIEEKVTAENIEKAVTRAADDTAKAFKKAIQFKKFW